GHDRRLDLEHPLGGRASVPTLLPSALRVPRSHRRTAAGARQIVCVFEDTGQKVFETSTRPIQLPPDPLDVVGVPFRIRDCSFPWPGLYSVQFWYDGVLVEERPLRLR